MTDNTYLALDLGGTKLLVGEVDADGHILSHRRYDSGQLSQEEALGLMQRATDDYMAHADWPHRRPAAMGIGLIGRIDNLTGTWHQIDADRTAPMPLARLMSDRFAMPCHVDNDVKAATRAEARWGMGRRSRDFIYINVGTGLAAGLVVDGRMVRGSHFNAGEVGHTVVGVQAGVDCVCGRRDCVELLAAGVGFDRCARLMAPSYESRLVIPTGEGERVSVADVFLLARQGDPLCRALADQAARALAQLIMNLVRVTDPDTIVLGGSVVADGYLLSLTERHLQAHTMRFVSGGVVVTQLSPQFIGLLGAAAVAMNQ